MRILTWFTKNHSTKEVLPEVLKAVELMKKSVSINRHFCLLVLDQSRK